MDSIEIKKENLPSAILDVLIGIYCHQKAFTNLIIDETLAVDATKGIGMITNHQKEITKAHDEIMKVIFENYGEMDLKNLFGDSKDQV